MTDGDIEASPESLTYDLLLILGLDPIEGQLAPAATALGQRYGDDFIRLLRREFGVSLAIS
jgi:hypothetical protein